MKYKGYKPKEEKKTMAEKKNFTEEQKAEILKYAEDTTNASAAKQYGVSTVTISRWKAAAKAKSTADKAKGKVKATRKKAEDKTEEVKADVKADVADVKEAAAEMKEDVKSDVAEIRDDVTAEKIEAKKAVRGKAAQAKEKVTAKRATRKEKIEDKKEERAEAKEQKAAEKAEKKMEKAANKPSNKVKTVKMNMIFQSTMGGAVTPEQIALKLPKDTVDAYVKLEENKVYYVLKDGSTGDVEIWS